VTKASAEERVAFRKKTPKNSVFAVFYKSVTLFTTASTTHSTRNLELRNLEHERCMPIYGHATKLLDFKCIG
jgi:hypothetical protein